MSDGRAGGGNGFQGNLKKLVEEIEMFNTLIRAIVSLESSDIIHFKYVQFIAHEIYPSEVLKIKISVIH